MRGQLPSECSTITYFTCKYLHEISHKEAFTTNVIVKTAIITCNQNEQRCDTNRAQSQGQNSKASVIKGINYI